MNLAETRSHVPLVNVPKVKAKKHGIKKVTPKRAKANREYSRRRLAYLKAHPYCQIFIKIHGLNEDHLIEDGGLVSGSMGEDVFAPRATTIHHSKKPKCKYLNDESTWFSASLLWHEWVENNKSIARKIGLLHDI